MCKLARFSTGLWWVQPLLSALHIVLYWRWELFVGFWGPQSISGNCLKLPIYIVVFFCPVSFFNRVHLHLSCFYEMSSTQWSIHTCLLHGATYKEHMTSLFWDRGQMKPNICFVCRSAEKRKCKIHWIHGILQQPNTVQWMLGRPNVSIVKRWEKFVDKRKWETLFADYICSKNLLVSKWSNQIPGLSILQFVMWN